MAGPDAETRSLKINGNSHGGKDLQPDSKAGTLGIGTWG